MHTRQLAGIAALAILVAARAGYASQVPPQPPGGRGQGPQVNGSFRQRKGSGRITGRVVTAGSGAPVRRALVHLGAEGGGAWTATTDVNGRYEFVDLPEGQYTVQVYKPGYVETRYGQTRPREASRPLNLAPKQVLDNVNIVLPRGGAIVGRVVDEYGDPVTDAQVAVSRYEWSGTGRRMVSGNGSANTDDLGHFRVYGLDPGDYYVSASMRYNMADLMVRGMPTPAPASTAARGGYAASYYPGTASPAEAQKITVTAGQDSQGVDFPLVLVRLSKITGVIVNADGRPIEDALVMAVPSPELEDARDTLYHTSRDGTFTLSGVSPGEYVLKARGPATAVPASADAAAGRPARVEWEFAAVPLMVAGDDVSNVVITTTKGASVSGRVTFEGGQPRFSTALVTAASPAATMSGVMDGPGGNGVWIGPDGTFEIRGLAGTRLIRVTSLPSGWAVKAVHANGVDVTDTGVEVKGTDTVGGLEVVVSSKGTEISGSASAADGTLVRNCTVVIFATDPQKWRFPSSRWIAGMRPDQDGRFRLRSMPAGSYFAVAVEYLRDGEWNDPDVLERLEHKAQRFSLGDGETRALELKITGGID